MTRFDMMMEVYLSDYLTKRTTHSLTCSHLYTFSSASIFSWMFQTETISYGFTAAFIVKI